MKRIAVYCASRFDPNMKYLESFNQLADQFISQGIDVIYGGANVGYMQVLAKRIADSESQLIGVMPEFLVEKELVFEGCDEFIYVKDLPGRIQKIMEIADGFLVMPGGVGTYEELMDMLSWVQLGLHHKPVGVVNVDGFYDGIQTQLQRGLEDELISSSLSSQVFFHEDPAVVLEWMSSRSKEEYWDVFDEQGKQTAIVHPRSVPLMANQYHKVGMIVFVNEDKEVLIQKRAPHVAHPNLWDFSAGGSVLAGEEPVVGANREIMEELGVSYELQPKDFFFQFSHRNMIIDVYLVNKAFSNFDFSISNEVTEVKWVSLDTIGEMIADKSFKHSFVQTHILSKLYEKLS